MRKPNSGMRQSLKLTFSSSAAYRASPHLPSTHQTAEVIRRPLRYGTLPAIDLCLWVASRAEELWLLPGRGANSVLSQTRGFTMCGTSSGRPPTVLSSVSTPCGASCIHGMIAMIGRETESQASAIAPDQARCAATGGDHGAASCWQFSVCTPSPRPTNETRRDGLFIPRLGWAAAPLLGAWHPDRGSLSGMTRPQSLGEKCAICVTGHRRPRLASSRFPQFGVRLHRCSKPSCSPAQYIIRPPARVNTAPEPHRAGSLEGRES